MTIAILGANGQVAAEVTLLLAQNHVDVVPIARSTHGSAFLRSMGVPVCHGRAENISEARELFGAARTIASFVWPAGANPRVLRRNNDAIIDTMFECSHPDATIVFFSTASVYPDYQEALGRPAVGFYGREKLRNEARIRRQSRRFGKAAFILRLGHCMGALQRISALFRTAIQQGPVYGPDFARASNTVQVSAIADLLARIESNEASPGTYDLFNHPQWTWLEVLKHEARSIGVEPDLRIVTASSARRSTTVLRKIIANPMVQSVGRSLLAEAPADFAERVRLRWQIARAAREIADLRSHKVSFSALLTPGVAPNPPPFQPETHTLLANPSWLTPMTPLAVPWPPEIGKTISHEPHQLAKSQP